MRSIRRSWPPITWVLLAVFLTSPGAVSAEPGGNWEPASAMGTARAGHTATLLPDGRVLVVGGERASADNQSPPLTAELYDPRADTWRPTAPAAGQLSGAHKAVPLSDGTVLVIGNALPPGRGQASAVYDPRADRWRAAGTLAANHAMGYALTVLGDGSVLVTGGGLDWPETAAAERYDPRAGTWRPAGSMTTKRMHHAAVLLTDGTVLVVGGEFTRPTAERYDPATDTWRATGNPGVLGSAGHAVALEDGTVLILGATGRENVIAAERYDPRAETWRPAGASGLTNATAPVPLPGGRLLLLGTEPSGREGRAVLYDPRTDIWQPTSPMTTNRLWPHVTQLRDGTVLVSGGDPRGEMWPPVGPLTAEVYDPAAGRWRDAGAVPVGDGHTATVLPNGRVLLAGGFLYPDHLAAAALFRPAGVAPLPALPNTGGGGGATLWPTWLIAAGFLVLLGGAGRARRLMAAMRRGDDPAPGSSRGRSWEGGRDAAVLASNSSGSDCSLPETAMQAASTSAARI